MLASSNWQKIKYKIAHEGTLNKGKRKREESIPVHKSIKRSKSRKATSSEESSINKLWFDNIKQGLDDSLKNEKLKDHAKIGKYVSIDCEMVGVGPEGKTPSLKRLAQEELGMAIQEGKHSSNDVIQHTNVYAIEQGFATRLDCTEKNLSIIIRAEIVSCHTAEYYIKYVNLEHNHLMDTAVAVFDSSYCKLSNSKNNQMLMLYNSRISVLIIIKILNEEYKRYIHNKDMYNSLNHQSYNHVKGLSKISQLL
ncbi:4543_t:CDS:2, partial [Cetraspora pellucida]